VSNFGSEQQQLYWLNNCVSKKYAALGQITQNGNFTAPKKKLTCKFSNCSLYKTTKMVRKHFMFFVKIKKNIYSFKNFLETAMADGKIRINFLF